MAQRNKHFGLKVLIGMVFGILLVDVVVLIILTVPLRVSKSRPDATLELHGRETGSVLELALILPTHDPNKPWPTRTPTPAPTPWLILRSTATPLPPATPLPTELAAVPPTAIPLVAAQPAPTSPLRPVASGSQKALADMNRAGSPIETPTATPDSSIGVPIATPTPLTPIEGAAVPDATATDTAPDAAGVTPEVSATPAPPPFAPADEAQFVAYVQNHYNTLAGQALNIASVGFAQTQDGFPAVQVDIDVKTENNAMTEQTSAVLGLAYNLLHDTKYYFAGQPCGILITGYFDTASLDPCINNPGWCYLNGTGATGEDWSISWIYARGSFDGDVDSILTWSSSQDPEAAAP